MNLIQIEAREGRVKLNDAVSPWSADELIDDLEKLYGNLAVEAQMKVGEFVAAADDALETVYLEINSPGGSVTDGYRVFHSLETMKRRGVRVVATINGKAASMATVIAMAADHINITKGSLMLIHDASVSTHGNAEEHRKAADTLEQISAEIAGIYAERSGELLEDIRFIMAQDRWMTAKEALELGLVDAMEGDDEAAAVQDVDISALDLTLDADMNPFTSRKDLVASVDDLKAQLEAASTLNDEQGEQLATATAELAESREQLAANADLLTAAQNDIEERDEKIAALEASVEEAKVEIDEAEASAGAKAAEEVAAAGHPPIDVEPDEDGPKSSTPHLDKFEALAGAEAAKYYRDNKAALRAEMRA